MVIGGRLQKTSFFFLKHKPLQMQSRSSKLYEPFVLKFGQNVRTSVSTTAVFRLHYDLLTNKDVEIKEYIGSTPQEARGRLEAELAAYEANVSVPILARMYFETGEDCDYAAKFRDSLNVSIFEYEKRIKLNNLKDGFDFLVWLFGGLDHIHSFEYFGSNKPACVHRELSRTNLKAVKGEYIASLRGFERAILRESPGSPFRLGEFVTHSRMSFQLSDWMAQNPTACDHEFRGTEAERLWKMLKHSDVWSAALLAFEFITSNKETFDWMDSVEKSVNLEDEFHSEMFFRHADSFGGLITAIEKARRRRRSRKDYSLLLDVLLRVLKAVIVPTQNDSSFCLASDVLAILKNFWTENEQVRNAFGGYHPVFSS